MCEQVKNFKEQQDSIRKNQKMALRLNHGKEIQIALMNTNLK